MEESAKNRNEIILDYFKSAKEEVYVRIKLRDSLLAIYTAAASATFAFAKASGDRMAVGDELSLDLRSALLALPYLCFAFTLLISYHHQCISTLGAYIKFELCPGLHQVRPKIAAFDDWKGFNEQRSWAQRLRTLGQGCILLSPPTLALWLNVNSAATHTMDAVYFWLGSMALAASTSVIVVTHLQQRKVRGRRHTDRKSSEQLRRRKQDEVES